MTPVADIERPAVLRTVEPVAPRGQTLQDVLCGVWEDLCAHRTATCPICAGAMSPRYGSGPAAVAGRCDDCETELA